MQLKIGYEQIVSNSSLDPIASLNAEIVVDARSRGRYAFPFNNQFVQPNPIKIYSYLGTDPEPRPGLSSGHIPHSLSLPFNTFLQTHTSPSSPTPYTTFLSPADIRKALVHAVGPEYAELIIKGEKPIVTSCGSGMTAGILWLGLRLIGVEKIGLYDEVRLSIYLMHVLRY